MDWQIMLCSSPQEVILHRSLEHHMRFLLSDIIDLLIRSVVQIPCPYVGALFAHLRGPVLPVH